ncbi:unnamed protein product, partial [Ostreobium quekettii]|eukprot:evm.model.scf_1384.5 EVM.evm.TU.scf_1384.5   scf_1384:36138-38774(+)
MAVAVGDMAFRTSRDSNPFRQGELQRGTYDFRYDSGNYRRADSGVSGVSAASSSYHSPENASDHDSYCSVAEGYLSQGPEIIPRRTPDGLVADAGFGRQGGGVPLLHAHLPPLPSSSRSWRTSEESSFRTASTMREMTSPGSGSAGPGTPPVHPPRGTSAGVRPGGHAGGQSDFLDADPYARIKSLEANRFTQFGQQGRRRAKKPSMWKRLIFRGSSNWNKNEPEDVRRGTIQQAGLSPGVAGGVNIDSLPEHLAMMSLSSMKAQRYTQKYGQSQRGGGNLRGGMRSEYYDHEPLVESSQERWRSAAEGAARNEVEMHLDEFLKASVESFAPLRPAARSPPIGWYNNRAFSPRETRSSSPKSSESHVHVSLTTWDPAQKEAKPAIQDLMNTTPDHLMFSSFPTEETREEQAMPPKLMTSAPQGIDFFNMMGSDGSMSEEAGPSWRAEDSQRSIVVNIEVRESHEEVPQGSSGDETARGVQLARPPSHSHSIFSDSDSSSTGSSTPRALPPVTTGAPSNQAAVTGTWGLPQDLEAAPRPAGSNLPAVKHVQRGMFREPSTLGITSGDHIPFSIDSEYSQDTDPHILKPVTFQDKELFGEQPQAAGNATKSVDKSGLPIPSESIERFVNIPSMFTTETGFEDGHNSEQTAEESDRESSEASYGRKLQGNDRPSFEGTDADASKVTYQEIFEGVNKVLDNVAGIGVAGKEHREDKLTDLDSYGHTSGPTGKPHLSQKSRRLQAMSRAYQGASLWQEPLRAGIQTRGVPLEDSEATVSGDEYEEDRDDSAATKNTSDTSGQSAMTNFQGPSEPEVPRLKMDENFVPQLPAYCEDRMWTLAEVKRLSGVWMKDLRASDPPGPLCDFLELGWIFQKAITNSRHLQ